MLIRSKAPLRLGLAGGGTDVSPYSDMFGGNILNVTIGMYAYCTIEPTDNGQIEFYAVDRNERFSCEHTDHIPIEGSLVLHKGVYNEVVKRFHKKNLAFKMTTYSDAPVGSGLGASSSMVVAIIKCYMEWLNLPLGEYDIASMACKVERVDCGLAGGKQDQYAATFGGLNFMEFYANNKVIVNPLRIKRWIKNELENSLVLYFLGVSRESAQIINEQVKNTIKQDEKSVSAMHELKQYAVYMKEAVLTGNFKGFVDALNSGWFAKKKMADVITNNQIDRVYDYVIQNSASGAKISGAGGGGFMMIYVDPSKRYGLVSALKQLREGSVLTPSFVEDGAQGWTLY